MSRRFAVGVLTVLLIGLVGAARGEAAPLTDEGVVRLFVTGTPEDELVRRIETSQVDFDLTQEMIDELKIAGLPEAVIQAMIRRQAAMQRPQDAAEPTASPVAARLIVRLNPGRRAEGDGVRTRLRVLNDLDPRLAARLELRQTDLPITDLGIALFCRTADHVPDHWRAASPLGRDFANAARHKMLVYLSGAEAKPAGGFRDNLSRLAKVPGERDALPDLQLLTLAIPAQLAVEVEPGVAHDLTLGIAIRVGDSNYLAVSDHLDGVVVSAEGDTTVRAVLHGGSSKNPFKAHVKFEREPAADGS
jgi:hypothetical protein